MQFIYDWNTTFPGKDYCHFCKKKLGIFKAREVYAHFGFTYRFCKDCYREFKQTQKEVWRKERAKKIERFKKAIGLLKQAENKQK